MERYLKKIAARIFRFAVHGIKVIFQMPQGCCRFYPSCTEYAVDVIESLPIAKAVPAIAKRVLKCSLFRGVDLIQFQEPPSAGEVKQRE